LDEEELMETKVRKDIQGEPEEKVSMVSEAWKATLETWDPKGFLERKDVSAQ